MDPNTCSAVHPIRQARLIVFEPSSAILIEHADHYASADGIGVFITCPPRMNARLTSAVNLVLDIRISDRKIGKN
jgi:hypothetical protein